MEQRACPAQSDDSHFAALDLESSKINGKIGETRIPNPNPNREIRLCLTSSSTDDRDFATLQYDVLTKIAASFSVQNLRSASLVCKSWCEVLRPLWEGMLFLRWGKRFKYGHGMVRPNLDTALHWFLKAVASGSTLAVVEAGLIYWEKGQKNKAIAMYKKAAALGDPAGQCNLGIFYFQAEPPNFKEAVKWLYQASIAGNVGAQYQLALCLQQGRGENFNIKEAIRYALHTHL